MLASTARAFELNGFRRFKLVLHPRSPAQTRHDRGTKKQNPGPSPCARIEENASSVASQATTWGFGCRFVWVKEQLIASVIVPGILNVVKAAPSGVLAVDAWLAMGSISSLRCAPSRLIERALEKVLRARDRKEASRRGGLATAARRLAPQQQSLRPRI